MSEERPGRLGAAAGAAGVVLFLAGSLVIGERPGLDASGSEAAEFFDESRTRIQVCVALNVVATPLFVWFFATAVALAGESGAAARRAATTALACGIGFVALFLADNTALAVGALRPESMAADSELAAALQDFELLAMGAAAPLVAAMLVAFAVVALRARAVWPAWVGRLALAAALAYALRVGTLFTTEGPFAADGVLGLYVPVGAVAAWILVASAVLALGARRG